MSRDTGKASLASSARRGASAPRSPAAGAPSFPGQRVVTWGERKENGFLIPSAQLGFDHDQAPKGLEVRSLLDCFLLPAGGQHPPQALFWKVLPPPRTLSPARQSSYKTRGRETVVLTTASERLLSLRRPLGEAGGGGAGAVFFLLEGRQGSVITPFYVTWQWRWGVRGGRVSILGLHLWPRGMASVAFPLLHAVPHFDLPPPFLFLKLREGRGGERWRSDGPAFKGEGEAFRKLWPPGVDQMSQQNTGQVTPLLQSCFGEKGP